MTALVRAGLAKAQRQTDHCDSNENQIARGTRWCCQRWQRFAETDGYATQDIPSELINTRRESARGSEPQPVP